MTDNSEQTTPESGVSGQVLAFNRCSIITPETQFQAGLRPDDGSRLVRLFFGDQTDPESFATVRDLFTRSEEAFFEPNTLSPSVHAELVGYYRTRRDSVDYSALFVTRFSV